MSEGSNAAPETGPFFPRDRLWHPPALTPGPGGDPFGSFVLPTTGNYTIAIGGFDSTDAGSYPYRVTLTTTAVVAVPEPSTWAMFTIGLAGVGYLRRRKRA